MSESINIKTSEKTILVNDDPSRVIRFNPSDVMFADRFYKLIDDFKTQMDSYSSRAVEIEKNKTVDDNDIPVNTKDKLELTIEFCNYMDEKIDQIFGTGTSQAAFNGTKEIDVYEQFFEGLMPFIKKARAEKIEKYSTTTSVKKSKHRK